MYSRIAKALFDLLDCFVKVDLRIRGTEVPDALRVNEDYSLLAVGNQP